MASSAVRNGDTARLSPLGRFGQRISRHTILYGGVAFAQMAMGFVNLAVLTRFMDPSLFGQLAVLLFASSFLTILYDMGLLQGTFLRIYHTSGDEDEADVGADDPSLEVYTKEEQRRSLGTAMMLIAAYATIGTIIVWFFAAPVAQLLLHSRKDAHLVRLAALSAGLAAVWRLAVNVPRLDRRAGLYSSMMVARLVLALALSLPLVIAGKSLEGVYWGLIAGTSMAIAIVLVICRKNYKWRFSRDAASYILRKGARYLPVVLGFLIIAQADIFLISRYLPQSQVGIFRVAARIAALFTYFSSAFLTALGPLRRSPVFVAAARRGGEANLAGQMVLFYLMSTIWLLIGAAAGADLLARVAPASYRGVIGLIPAIAVGLLIHGMFAVTYRTSSFDNRLPRYGFIAMTAAVIFILVSLKMIPWFGLYGAAFAPCVAYIPAGAMLLWYSQRGPRPINFLKSQMARAVLIGATLIAAVEFARRLPLGARVGVDVAAVLVYLPLLVLTGVILRPQVRVLGQMFKGIVVRHKRRRRAELIARLRALRPADRAVLRLFVRDRKTVSQVRDRIQSSEAALARRTIRALGKVGDFDCPADEVGLMEWLFDADTVAARDAIGRHLWAGGADPDVADLADELVRNLRDLPARAWTAPAPVTPMPPPPPAAITRTPQTVEA